MDLKGLMSSLGMNGYALVALVLFFCSFVSILVWTFTRPRHEIEAESPGNLEDDKPASVEN